MTSPDYLLATPEENVPPVKSRLLRVGSYNVMDGGGDRWPAQVQLLAAQNLDILGIQEAKHWDRSGRARVYQTAEALGMQALFAPSQHHGCHLVLLYRWPSVSCLAFDPDISAGVFHHAASRAKFAVDGIDEPLWVIHTHLNPFSPSARLTETGWLTEYAAPSHLSLIIGDLNSGGLTSTGADREPDDWDLVPAHLYSRHRLVLPDGTYGGNDRRAMSALGSSTRRSISVSIPRVRQATGGAAASRGTAGPTTSCRLLGWHRPSRATSSWTPPRPGSSPITCRSSSSLKSPNTVAP